jgi:hypothetical protein
MNRRFEAGTDFHGVRRRWQHHGRNQQTPMNSKFSRLSSGPASSSRRGAVALCCLCASPIQIESLHKDGGFYQDAIHNMNVLPASLEITFENQSNVEAS